MIELIDAQPDCPTAWLEAVTKVDAMDQHSGHNVVIQIEDPLGGANRQHPVVAIVDSFLRDRGKSVQTIANTIFPLPLYQRYGHPEFITRFHNRILPTVQRNERWSGYYFERMTNHPTPDGHGQDQLSNVVRRISDVNNPCLNKFEIAIFDPNRDVDDSPYGGQCLSFLSFKIVPGTERRLALTALYRNHFYVEKLLGNLIGLGRLMSFVAIETGLSVGPLTVHSTHATVDTPGKAPLNRRACVAKLLEDCRNAALEIA